MDNVPSSRNERGNVIFIILIAVALFGALSMAISHVSSTDGSARGMDDQKQKIYANEMMEYANNISNVISRLRLNGCTQEQISFENDTQGGYENAFAPSDESCHVFSPEGGGMLYKQYDSIMTGSYVITNIGTGSTDLSLHIRTNRSRCMEINDILGIPNNGSEGPPLDKLSAGVRFQGDYTIASTASSNQRIVANSLKGKRQGCRTNSGSGDSAIFYFYAVLLAR